MELKYLRNKTFIAFLMAIIFSAILIILFFKTIVLKENLENTMIEISTTDIVSIARNSAKFIEKKVVNYDNILETIRKNKNIQKDIEENISLLLTNNIKYAYVIYKDKNNIFRFVSDASAPPNKAFFNQKLDIESNKWLDIYKIKKPIFIEHNYLKQLSITYLVPIIKDDEVKLILAIDYSVSKLDEINSIIDIIQNTVIAIIVTILIFLIIMFIQTIRYKIMKISAYTDKLTGVYNRNYLVENEDIINLEDKIIATVDIDHFKKVNDTYGHNIGDSVLKSVAGVIKKSIRTADDMVIRYGGEEFLIIVKATRTDKKLALDVIHRVHKNIQKEQISIGDNETIKVTVSIGVNLNPNKSKNLASAFKLSDIALYNAKESGRNKIEIYNENENTNHDDNLSINEIKLAIEEHRIKCFFQKIICNKNEELSHYEALLRIEDKNGEIIPPNKILPVVKGTFIARKITRKVLFITYKCLRKNPNISINVNLTSQDIVNETILDILNRFAKKENIASRLGLEIIESEEIINYKSANESIIKLKKLGYKIYIDDFGSGYSNFIYLTKINTDYIKIDGSIIQNILVDNNAYLVVKSIVEFAKAANIKTIAEYVSDEEIYKKVKEMGIDYSQGFLFGKPSKVLEKYKF